MTKKKFFTLAAAAATAILYSAVTGKGVFNRMRFKNEHDAIARYVESNYPGAAYSPIQKTEMGYAAVIRRPNRGAKIMLYAMPCEGGHYVFKEVV